MCYGGFMSTFREYHISEELVDRIEEYAALMQEIRSVSKSKGTIICAKTGVGKTALSNKIVNSLDGTYNLIINIKTDPENSSTNYKEGRFLADIFAKAIIITNTSSKLKKYTFPYFISHSKNKSLKKAKKERIVEDIFHSDTKIDVYKTIAYYIFRHMFRLNEFNSESFINDDRNTNVRIINYYMQYLFSHLKIFLKIDNIQNVDEKSLSCILGWMNEFQNMGHYFLYEYTLDKKNSFQKAIQLTENFQDTGISVTLRELDYLQDNDALSVLKMVVPYKNYTDRDEKAIKYYYNNLGNGNIRKLIDYDCDSSNNDSYFYDPTYEKLCKLEKDELYIVAIIILCNGNVTTTFYEGLLQSDPLVKNKMRSLEILCEKNNRILEIDNGNIKIEHASIIDSWNQHEGEFRKFSLLAYSRLDNFLRKEIETKTSYYISKHRATILLLQLYKKYQFESIINLLDEVERLSCDELSVNNVWEILKIIVDATTEKAYLYTELYLRIFQICFRCELYNEGFECIEILENTAQISLPAFYIYKCLYLSALDKHDESIIIAHMILTTWENDTRIALNAKLIMLNNYRSLNDKSNCLKIGQEIEQNTDFQKCPEYGYFLRLTPLFLSRANSITHINASIEYFNSIGNTVQEGKSLITYSNYLALEGRVKDGKKSLAKAELKLKHTKIGKHMLLVNKSAIMLLDNDFSIDVWDLLEQAELSAIVPFDKLAILNNKLIWCMENKDYTKADLIINQIKRLFLFEPDKHLHAFMNYNLYLFYSDLKIDTEAKKYYKKANELREHCYTLYLRLSHKTDSSNSFLLSKRWHVCFLEYWTFDVLL